MTLPELRRGKIVSFYSYKGGTGRSLALANVAWILAANGKRVLTVDWDLEAPGLHRYFLPFLRDPELAETRGVVDLVWDYTNLVLSPRKEWPSSVKEATDLADVRPYVVALENPFASLGGSLHFLSAGQQTSSYASRFRDLDWRAFYERLGGGAFVDALASQFREQYDYVLIDSRTGVADTSGICTVHLPDEVILCFTYNRQSVKGVAAVAQSVRLQRDQPPVLWPLPMRVEKGAEGLNEARDFAHDELDRFLPPQWTSEERASYWEGCEVSYYPDFALGEALAVFRDRPQSRNSLTADLRWLASRLLGPNADPKIPSLDAVTREMILLRYKLRDPRRAELAELSSQAPTSNVAARLLALAGDAQRERRVDPDFDVELAAALDAHALRASGTGQHELALSSAVAAVEVHRRQSDRDESGRLPRLSASLINLAVVLAAMGRPEDALAANDEAVQIYRALAQARPDTVLPELATSLNNLGTRLSDLGRRDDALRATEEAVEIRRHLVQAAPDAYQSDLATSLNHLGNTLSELGRYVEAVAITEEAVQIRRRLAEGRPDAFLSDLATSLDNLSNLLSDLGSRDRALAIAEEAVQVHRRLAQIRPEVSLADLAISLNRLGNLLSGLDRREEALTAVEEAVQIHRRLARSRPDASLPELAASLNELGNILPDLGRREEALAAREEAATIHHRLETQRTGGTTYFLSHSSGDEGIVRELRKSLADMGVPITIDSRELHGGYPQDATIRRAIGRSSGVLVLITARAMDSAAVARELKHGLKVQVQRGGRQTFPVVPLMLDGASLGAFAACFDQEPLTVAIRSTALDVALFDILVALRHREPTDAAPVAPPESEPIEDLVLQLSDPTVVLRTDGTRRVSAIGRLVHEASATNARAVHGSRFRFDAPLGVIEAEDLRWYMEDYALLPTVHDVERMRRIEDRLAPWGRTLHDAALPVIATTEPLKSWSAAVTKQLQYRRSVRSAGRFSIEVDAAPLAGTSDDAAKAAQTAATMLLGLPWELLHDGRSFMIQGPRPVGVRRRVPSEHAVASAILATPVRVLVASPRPEDGTFGYFDHRASALPLVEAFDAQAGRVELFLLVPPTLPALREELGRARRDGRPYHVLHFDGHGIYDREAGLGALCFENPEDAAKPVGKRRHATVSTPEFGALLRDHGIPLVFLEASRAAETAEFASESVASALLKTGVGSVVVMSYSMRIEASRRFVEAFYGALCGGRSVGSAMLEGQRTLKERPERGRVLGIAEFTLQDWFVPVLYQDRDDPQLFLETPPKLVREDWRERQRTRLHALPGEPPQGFVGRSRELLALERLLAVERYAVLRGQGGEGKTALAAEFGRWRVRARQVERVAFVSIEQHADAPAVLDAIGRQLVGSTYSVAAHSSLDQAAEPVLRELRERTPTLVIVDNLESVLAPPFLNAGVTADAHSSDTREAADAILGLCAKLSNAGATTRIVFTSREALPAPFDGVAQRIELHRLNRRDAVALVERSLGLDAAGRGGEAEAKREEIEALVDAVHCHARTLALLAPTLRERGPAVTQEELSLLMAEMERRFPGQREESLLATVELSLRRLTAEQRDRARVIGVFHGAVDLDMLRAMMGWEQVDALALGEALVATGLATPQPYNHLSLNPALCPYLAATLSETERVDLEARWSETMLHYAAMLQRESKRNATMAAALTVMELPNLIALLNLVQASGNAEATIDLTTTLHQLLQYLGRPRLLARIAHTRDAAEQSLAGASWSHARFQAESTRCRQLVDSGRVGEALAAAQKLHARAATAGDGSYRDADSDYEEACLLFGRTLRGAGQAGAALLPLEDAKSRFEAKERREPGRGAARSASLAIVELAEALTALGRLEEAAQRYEEAMARAKELGDERQVAFNGGQLGYLRLLQGRHADALRALSEARNRFEMLGEPGSVALAWHQIGMVLKGANQSEAAEDAYRRSLALEVQLGNLAGQARNLGQLGNLYANLPDRTEEAVTHYRQAVEAYAALGDVAGEGRQHNNLANLLRRVGRIDEARASIDRAISGTQGLGHAAMPWRTWSTLCDIENEAGREHEAAAARELAKAAYLAYRRDGGEPQPAGGQLVAEVGRLLAAGDAAAADALLHRLAANPDLPAWARPLLPALEAVLAGDRNPAFIDGLALNYDDAAEVQLLVETLNASAGGVGGVPGSRR